MVRCAICGILTPCPKLSFHSFPLRNKELCKKWSAVVPRKNFQPNQHTKVCSRHFTEDSYMKGYVSKKKLVEDALPTLNLTKISNEVENTPVDIPQDHAYCRGKMKKKMDEILAALGDNVVKAKPVENEATKSRPLENEGKKSHSKLVQNKIPKSGGKLVDNSSKKILEFSNENKKPVQKEKTMKSNQGILIDTSQYQVIELPDNYKLDDLMVESTVIHYKNIVKKNPPNYNNNNIIEVSNKASSAAPNVTAAPWHSDHIYNKSLQMIEKQESILRRKEKSIKKLRLKLINSQKKSRRQELQIKELKDKIMELMVRNANQSPCSDCLGKHFLLNEVK